MRISDWSSDVCSSDLLDRHADTGPREPGEAVERRSAVRDLDGADEFRTGVREGLDDPASVFVHDDAEQHQRVGGPVDPHQCPCAPGYGARTPGRRAADAEGQADGSGFADLVVDVCGAAARITDEPERWDEFQP